MCFGKFLTHFSFLRLAFLCLRLLTLLPLTVEDDFFRFFFYILSLFFFFMWDLKPPKLSWLGRMHYESQKYFALSQSSSTFRLRLFRLTIFTREIFFPHNSLFFLGTQTLFELNAWREFFFIGNSTKWIFHCIWTWVCDAETRYARSLWFEMVAFGLLANA